MLSCDLFGEQILQFFAIFEIYRDVEIARHIGLADVELLEQSGEEVTGVEGVSGRRGGLAALAWTPRLRWGQAREGARPHMFHLLLYVFGYELGQVFPEEFAAVYYPASPHVKQIYRQHAVFIVIAEDVGVIAFGGGDALAFLQLLDG